MTLTRSPVRGSQSQLVASENLSPIRINAFGYRALLAAHSSPKRETPSPATIPLKHYKEGTRPGTPRPYMEDEEVTGQLEHRAKTRIEVRTATPQIGSQKGPVPRPWMTLPRSAATFQKGLTVRSIPQATRSRVTRWSESIVAPVNPLLPASPKETESEAEAPAPAPVEPGPVPEIRCVSPSTVNHQSLAEGYVADAESILEDEYAAPAEQEYDAGVGSATPLSTFFEADLSIHQSQPFIDGRQVVTNDMLRERLDSANYRLLETHWEVIESVQGYLGRTIEAGTAEDIRTVVSAYGWLCDTHMELISRLRPVLEHRYEPTMSPTRSQFAAPEHVEQSPTTTKIGRSFVDNSPRPKERNWRMQRPFVQETAPTSVAGLSTDIAMLKIKEMTAEAKRKRELRQQASRIPVPQSSGKPAQKATNYWKDAAETTSSLRARLEKLCDAQNNMKSKRCLVGPEPFEKSR